MKLWIVEMTYKAWLTEAREGEPEFWKYYVLAEDADKAAAKIWAYRESKAKKPDGYIRKVWEAKSFIQ
jgi:hypothetical protein